VLASDGEAVAEGDGLGDAGGGPPLVQPPSTVTATVMTIKACRMRPSSCAVAFLATLAGGPTRVRAGGAGAGLTGLSPAVDDARV
jgi:hypothetical protein